MVKKAIRVGLESRQKGIKHEHPKSFTEPGRSAIYDSASRFPTISCSLELLRCGEILQYRCNSTTLTEPIQTQPSHVAMPTIPTIGLRNDQNAH